MRHRLTLFASAGLWCACAFPPPAVPDPAAIRFEATRELDDFHAAAAAADETRYFAHFARDSVFLGTDATERWDVAAFRAYAHPHFATGKGWTYEPGRRAITSTPNGDVVWFDEDLKNAHLGVARGSGVLVREDGRLKVAQYNLTVPIPNARMAAVVALVQAVPPAPPTLDAIYTKAYEAATTYAGVDPLAEAAKLLEGALPEAKKHPDLDTELRLHDELTWVRWRQGDLAGALGEVDAAEVALEHGTLPEAKRAIPHLHALWNRAYLLLETAMRAASKNAAEKAKALERAQAAKTAYDALATASHETDGMAVLEAFFLLRAGKGKEAAAAARKVDLEKDEDLLDLYVLAEALDAGGDAVTAEAIVGRICTGHPYLMKPLLLGELAQEGKRCAAR